MHEIKQFTNKIAMFVKLEKKILCGITIQRHFDMIYITSKKYEKVFF